MIHVVVFEDNMSLREGLRQLISGSPGFQCAAVFPDCTDLLKNIEATKPDVVLMDIGLPGMNGIEAVQLITEKYPEMKILMQTIFEENDKIFASICAGASGYILKNTPAARILESIKEVHEGGAPMSPSVATKVLKMINSGGKLKIAADFNLTEREKEVLNCLVKGMSYKLIAEACFISVDTVRGHIRHVYEKLHVHSKSEAVLKALKERIV